MTSLLGFLGPSVPVTSLDGQRRPLWSSVIGQYNVFGWLVGSDQQRPRSFNQLLMTVVKKLAALFGLQKKKIFWISKLFETESVKADEMMGCLSEVLNRLPDHIEWSNLGF